MICGKKRIAVFCLFGLFLFPLSTFPQEMSLKQAQEISREAMSLVKQQCWEAATELLNASLQRCGAEEQAKKSRGLLNFSLGYLYRHQADHTDERRNFFLEKSAEHYQKVLRDLPDNADVMKNLGLVLQSLGQWKQAVKFFTKAAEEDIEKQAAFLIEIGDIYLKNAGKPDARKFYDKAYRLNPFEDIAARRILNLYQDQELPKKDLVDLFNFCQKLKSKHPQLALDGFEQVINRFYREDKYRSMVESALVDWAELAANRRWMSSDDLRSLPSEKEWDSVAIQELRQLLLDPSTAAQVSWWLSSLYRRHVIASVMKALGNRLLFNSKLQEAVELYQILIWEIAPKQDDYYRRYDAFDNKLLGKPVIKLDTAIELARLYHAYPQLDDEGREFHRLEESLFDEKSLAYRENDLSAIQKYHTILGIIYAEKDQWESENPFQNAFYQLKRALEVSHERKKRNPKDIQLLPHVKSLLAEGYVKKGELSGAIRNYLDVALDYLDLDSLNKAKEMLAIIDTLEVSADIKNEMNGLKQILDTRSQIIQIDNENFDPESEKYYKNSEVYVWLFNTIQPLSDRSFVNRQRFKSLADMSVKARESGKSQMAQDFQASAIEAIEREVVLPSLGDIVRLEYIEASFLPPSFVEEGPVYVWVGHDLESNSLYEEYKIWSLPSESGRNPLQVGVPPTFLTLVKRKNN